MTKYEQALLDIIQEKPKDKLNDITILTELVKNSEKAPKQVDRALNKDKIVEDTLMRVYACIKRSKVKFTDNIKESVLIYAIQKEFNLDEKEK